MDVDTHNWNGVTIGIYCYINSVEMYVDLKIMFKLEMARVYHYTTVLKSGILNTFK